MDTFIERHKKRYSTEDLKEHIIQILDSDYIDTVKSRAEISECVDRYVQSISKRPDAHVSIIEITARQLIDIYLEYLSGEDVSEMSSFDRLYTPVTQDREDTREIEWRVVDGEWKPTSDLIINRHL